MPRVYVRKTNRTIDERGMKLALKDCFRRRISIREAARRYNIKRDTLMSRMKAVKKRALEEKYCNSSDSGMSSEEEERKFHSKYSVLQVFSVSEENSLVEYIKKSSTLHYGMSKKQVRVLAFEYALRLPCRMPRNWNENKIAGEDWLFCFMSRHPDLALRKPESTSILRGMGFNKARVEEFFENYCSLLEMFKFRAEQIYNLDETGITTVMRAPRVISEKGKKQVGQVSSGERGELVTFVGIVNAMGNALPPAYVVPRLRHPENYITGAPTSSLILNNKSGWMTKELFPKVLNHIMAQTRCSKEQRILLLLDNHESHISYESIKFCKANGISLLSFPPHSTHRLQPLDVGVYGPFKGSLVVAFNDWLLSNPGKAITIRNIGELSAVAFYRTFSISNITNAFKKTGIWPLNRQAFSDEDFAASTVTDDNYVPNPEAFVNQEDVRSQSSDLSKSEESNIRDKSKAVTSFQVRSLLDVEVDATASTSKDNTKKTEKHGNQTNILQVENVRPYPKAKIEKKRQRKRESKSKIYTSTPMMDEIKAAEEERNRKTSLKLAKTTKRKVFSQIHNETDVSDSSFEVANSDVALDEFSMVIEKDFIVKINDFVLTKFCTKTNKIYYIGQVLSREQNQYDVKFLRRKHNTDTFAFPVVDDISSVERDDIVMVLPPLESSGTARTDQDVMDHIDRLCPPVDEDFPEGIHSPTDSSEDSVEVKVEAICIRNKRKCAEPRRVQEGPLKKRMCLQTQTQPFRPWSRAPAVKIETSSPAPLFLHAAPTPLGHLGVDSYKCQDVKEMPHAYFRPPSPIKRSPSPDSEPVALVKRKEEKHCDIEVKVKIEDDVRVPIHPPPPTVENLRVPLHPQLAHMTSRDAERMLRTSADAFPRLQQTRKEQRNYKNMTRERRIEANARERTRVHTISAAFDTLRRAIPAYSHSQKLSKLSVLRVACNYIMTLSNMLQDDQTELGECVEQVTKTIQREGKLRKKKDESD